MIGSILSGKYQIVEKIGSGGMADVYKAIQMQSHRTVAIKVLKPEFEKDAAFVRRFEQEAHAVLGLSHENIVRSYDVGMREELPFIVLEYVEGTTLKERIRAQGKLQMRSVINYGAQVLDALNHAHERGIIHRDVKPQNIIVTPRGRIKLADFGIARNLESGTQTFSGSHVLGSVHYLSPEQAKGRQVTVESDVYSMGVTLYEMATGCLPFEGENSVSIALKHLQEEMVPPIVLNPELPRALNDIILKATRKQPSQRYHSAKEMRQDLLRVLREPDGDFARQAAEEAPVRLRRPRRSKTRGILRLVAVAIAFIAMFGVLLMTGRSMMGKEANANADLVPTLVGKTLEEAKKAARLRAYTTEVVATIASSEYPSGVVTEQKPAAGSPLKAGGVISITVSAGAEMPRVPDLSGMTLDDAENALTNAGLSLGNVEYRVSDQPLGTVFQQDPAPETSLLQGDDVNLFISGEPSKNVEMIDVTKMTLRKALSLLRERGFYQFLVRVANPADETAAGQTVTLQNPAEGESAPNTSAVELTVSGFGQEIYTADIAFSADIAATDTKLMAVIPLTLDGIAYEQVVYEATLPAGTMQNVSFTATIGEGGEHEMVVYQNGVEMRRTPVTFSYLG